MLPHMLPLDCNTHGMIIRRPSFAAGSHAHRILIWDLTSCNFYTSDINTQLIYQGPGSTLRFLERVMTRLGYPCFLSYKIDRHRVSFFFFSSTSGISQIAYSSYLSENCLDKSYYRLVPYISLETPHTVWLSFSVRHCFKSQVRKGCKTCVRV